MFMLDRRSNGPLLYMCILPLFSLKILNNKPVVHNHYSLIGYFVWILYFCCLFHHDLSDLIRYTLS